MCLTSVNKSFRRFRSGFLAKILYLHLGLIWSQKICLNLDFCIKPFPGSKYRKNRQSFDFLKFRVGIKRRSMLAILHSRLFTVFKKLPRSWIELRYIWQASCSQYYPATLDVSSVQIGGKIAESYALPYKIMAIQNRLINALSSHLEEPIQGFSLHLKKGILWALWKSSYHWCCMLQDEWRQRSRVKNGFDVHTS